MHNFFPDILCLQDVHVENQVVDKRAKLLHAKEIIANVDNPGYIKRNDTV